MNSLQVKASLILILFMITGCVSTKPKAPPQSDDFARKSCPRNTPSNPTTFIFVVLDKAKNWRPVDIVIPEQNLPLVDFKKNNKPFTSILKKDHEVRQRSRICWQAVVKDPSNSSGYSRVRQELTVFWSPSQNVIPRKGNYAEIEKVPDNSSVSLVYKYGIATRTSTPKDPDSYLDPRIVIKKRL